jgi:hypothetical protein
MNQGTYAGVVEVRDLADPSVLVKVPATLVLGTGKGTPTIAASPASLSVKLAAGKSVTEDVALSDASKVCGYGYSLSSSAPWATVSPDLYSGTVPVPAATSAPSSSDTGGGNGFTPVVISTKGLANGVYHASITVQSQTAVHNPTVVPLTLTVGSASKPPVIAPKPPKVCTRRTPLRFALHPPNGAKVRVALVYVNGKLVHTFRGKNLKWLTFARPAQRFSLRILTKLSDGSQWQRSSHYNGCKESGIKLKRVKKPLKKKPKKRHHKKKHKKKSARARVAITGFTG